MTSDPLARRLAVLTWPRLTYDAPDPKAGQLWRASWDDAACLVVVLSPPQRRRVRVAGASAEQIGDGSTVVTATEVGVSPAVWGSVVADIAMATLEYRLGDLLPDAQGAVGRSVSGRGPDLWPPITDVLDDRRMIEADLRESLELLGGAEWVPEASGASIVELARRANVDVAQVQRTLGGTAGDARRLLQGRREVRPEEVPLLTPLLGAVPGQHVTYPDDLVESVDRPRFREPLDRRAQSRGIGRVEVRRALAQDLVPMAARPRSGRRDWSALIEEELGAD